MSVEYIPGLEADTQSVIDCEATNSKSIRFRKDDEFSASSVNRTDILDFGNEGFLLHKILTDKECGKIINEGEQIGFGTIKGASDTYRSAQRILVDSPELADLLWERVRSYVGSVKIVGEPREQHIQGIPFVMQGIWEPTGLNRLFRLCRYEPGGHFAPHFDGYYQRSAADRSLKTLMVYLNGDFSGGSTNFVDERQTLHKDESGKYCAEDKNILHRIRPETGMAIIFNHHRLHEGQQLRDKKKYILRTDIMYKKTDNQDITEAQEEAHKCLQEAEKLEAEGECMKAAALYRKAYKLCPELENCY